jgi:hypothetical protein
MKRLTTLLAAAALLAFASSSPAEVISWGYSVDRDRPAIEADVPGTGGITLTNELFRTAQGESDIVLSSLSTFSSAPFDKPDKFTNANYALTLTITDVASGATGNLTFSGKFNGILSKAYAQITNEFTGQTSAELRLGSNIYTIRIGPYVPPPVPGASNTGSIGARVSVRTIDLPPPIPVPDPIPIPPPTPIDTPEPSSLVLAGLGLLGFGLNSLRKRRS